jgi:membrane associated rhomboid family serine protease
METEGRKLKWFERLFEYDEEKAQVEQFGRGIYKWFLEFVRNCMVVAALAYVAQKSGNWLMYGVAGLAYAALAFYCLSYVEVWRVRLDFLGSRLRMAVRILIGVVILQSIQVIITVGLFGTIYKIVQTQAH